MAQQTPVLILKEGSTRTQGKDVIMRNIKAAGIIADIVKSSLGPKGMDKMLAAPEVSIVTNDGAVMLKAMFIEHPAARMMVEVAKTQDAEVGDGTISAVVLAGKLLEKAGDLIEKEVHPTIIVHGYERATEKTLAILNEIAIEVKKGKVDLLKKVALTSIASKIVNGYGDQLADIAVKAALSIKKEVNGKTEIDLNDIGIMKKKGASIKDTKLIDGIIIDRAVILLGMPNRIENAKIALVNYPIDIKKAQTLEKITIERPEQMKAFLNEEQTIINDMVDKIISTGANVLFCQQEVHDTALLRFARAGVMVIKNVKKKDMDKLIKATGGKVVDHLDDFTSKYFGEAALVEERKLDEADRWMFVEGCKNPKSRTILIRADNEKVVNEVDQALHDALSAIKDVLLKPYVVAGGGASEAEAASRIREWALSFSGKEQLAATKFAEALEAIPLTLAENSGLDTINMEVELRSNHKRGKTWAGIDISNGKVSDMLTKGIVEPLLVKEQMIKSATEATLMLLRVDDVITTTRMPERKKEEDMAYGLPERK